MGCCAYPMRGVPADRGSTPPQCPAVRRNGNTALMEAAHGHYDAIVTALLAARADANTRAGNSKACACAAMRWRVGGRPLRRPMRRPPRVGRYTALHLAAGKGHAKCILELLVGGANESIRTNATRKLISLWSEETVETERAKTARDWAESNRTLTKYTQAVEEVRPPPSCRPLPPPPLHATHATHPRRRTACAAMRRSTRRQPGCFGVRRGTCGMMCASLCARPAAAIARQKVVRVRTASPPTVRRQHCMTRSRVHNSRQTANWPSHSALSRAGWCSLSS